MARQTKEDRLASVHSQALREFDLIQSSIADERKQCLQDRRFYSIAGAQWEGDLGLQFENKPKFEVNKIHLAVMRIINEYRNNRITVNFVAKDGDEVKSSVSDTVASLYRASEQDSVAEEAYDNGFEEAVGGGFGAWRLRTEYEDDEDEDDERQRISIEPIFDADSSVFFDLGAKRYDKADAKHCFVLSSMTRDAYSDEWGEDPDSFDKQVTEAEYDWVTADVVFVAEYYRVEEKSEIVHIYRGIDGEERKVRQSELDDDAELEDTLAATGFREARQKKVKVKRIHKYILSGARVLEDCGFIAGKCIPIVPVYGKRWFVDNVERCMGHVRLAKDAQRLKNMQMSKLAEIAALSSVEKPIFLPEQIAGHETMWAEDSVSNYPYLLNNAVTDLNGNPTAIGPQAYTRPPSIPPAMAALLQVTEQDMMDVLGNQQAGEQLQSNISGKAVELIQGKLDMQAFIYMSNMSKSVKRCGEIWLSIAKDIFVEQGRKLKGVGDQGEVSMVELMRPIVNEAGEIEHENDLSEADLDVAVDVGPSSASKRQSTVRALTGMMQITPDPETVQVLGAMAMLNMEGEGIQDVRDYFRMRLIKKGVVKPTDSELQSLLEEQQNAPIDPNAIFLQASAEQAQANAAKAKADVLLSVAKSKETEAKTIETLAGIDMAQRDQLMRTVQQLGQSMQTSGETPPL
jgi:hypothetical protein